MKPMRRVGWMVALVVATTAGDCGGPVTISETEVWWLHLEQDEDGSAATYPRRGSIFMKLTVNTTTQPDPACTDERSEDVTTFLADVEALPSRLQNTAQTGTADGSWNCHGFAASVRMADGTTYELRSELPGRPLNGWGGRTWAAGARHGEFLITDRTALRDDSHFDLLMQNRDDHEWEVALADPWYITEPIYVYYSAALAAAGLDPPLAYVDVLPTGTMNLSWPAHEDHRSFWPHGLPLSYTVAVRPPEELFLGREFSDNERFVVCVLGPDHPDQVHFIIDEDGEPSCGDGWLGGIHVTVTESPLFVHAGATVVTDSALVIARGGSVVLAESSDPGITLSVDPVDPPDEMLLRLSVAPGTPRGEHTVTVTAVNETGEDTARAAVPVLVYELQASATPDVLTISPGVTDAAQIEITTLGGPFDVALSLDAPDGIASDFTPTTVSGGVSTLRVGLDAGPPSAGSHDATVCARIVIDPRWTCHNVPLTIVVTSGTNEAPIVTIHTPQDGVTFTAGDPIEFSASASDAEDGALTGGALAWSSDVDGTLGAGEVVVRNDLSVGSHTITLQGTDSGGATDVATVSITIIPAGAVRRGS